MRVLAHARRGGECETPTADEEASAKPPLPLLATTDTVTPLFLAQTKSTLPSPFTSAAVTERGAPPTPGEEARPKPPLPLFVNTESVSAPLFAPIKSTL